MNMSFTPEQFIATNQANVEAIKGLTIKAFAGFEKLAELNLAAATALSAETFSHVQALLGAKDAKQLLELQAGLVKPMTEKSAAYSRHVYTIATESNAEITQAVEAKVAEAQKALGAVVENVAKNAPAGSESVVTALKNALTTGQNAMETAKNSTKNAIEMAETNFKAAANQAVNAVAAASKKA